MKRVAIVQSNYLPWKGYFDLIGSVDDFVIYDSVQYTRRDWRNRNKIKTRNGLTWITVPVKVKGKYDQSILATEIDGDQWLHQHLSVIRHAYAHAPCFDSVFPFIEQTLTSAPATTISALNRHVLQAVCAWLGITTRFHNSTDFSLAPERTERLASICEQLGAEEYVSGPAAKAYMDENVFQKKGIAVRWKSYSGYPEYEQVWPPFDHGVSIVDLMFSLGKQSPQHLHSAIPFEP